MIREIKQILSRNLGNIPGWRTDRKIVVIESDDWGSIRMPNKKVYDESLKAGLKVEQCVFCKYDTLADSSDLTALFEVLSSFKDKNGNSPVITANSVLANPDFNKIREGNFSHYYYEPFQVTLEHYYPNDHTFDLWKQGLEEKIFHPQFHGREHLNISRWLKYLKSGSEETLFAFDRNFFGLSTNVVREKRDTFMAAFDADSSGDADSFKSIVADGLNLFERTFGFKSLSFIAPNYTWTPLIESQLMEDGVRYIQGVSFQKTTKLEANKPIKHRLGDLNEVQQLYLVRNCFFEPSELSNRITALDNCLKQIETAFRWNKPAIISSHRVNFIGVISEDNRAQNLLLLKELLSQITRKWPNVEFITSDQLGDIISKK